MAPSRHQRIKRDFGKRLATARLAAGYETAAALSQLLGMEDATYRRYERGEVEPNFELLLRICAVLKVTPNDLIMPFRPAAPTPDDETSD